MNAQNLENKPVIKRESKNKIRVDFDRTPLWQRLKSKFLSLYFLKTIVWWIFRFVLMLGISYIVLNPFLTMILQSFMAPQDFIDASVRLVPKNFSLDIYRNIVSELGYFNALKNTFTLSLTVALIQTFICSLIGYGFAKFKFKGRSLLFGLVVLTMIIPHQTLFYAMRSNFEHFDILGIVKLLKGGGIELFGYNLKEAIPALETLDILPDTIRFGEYVKSNGALAYTINMNLDMDGINLRNTYMPYVIMSLGGLAFKNGLYIFLLRQFFRGVPDELEESAYMDGSGVFKTFFRIIMPLSIPMMITVFLFAFCWQWTDTFYSGVFYDTNSSVVFLATRYNTFIPSAMTELPETMKMVLESLKAGKSQYFTTIKNTCAFMLILPLVIMYMFCQKFLVQGIEQSGLAN